MNQSDGDSVRSDIALALLVAGRRVEDRIETALSVHGLSFAKLNVLNKLVDADRSLSLGEIAERLACVRSNVTQLVDRLEADGLVKREPDPNDRRGVKAVITEAGREQQRAGTLALAAVQDEISQSLLAFDTAHLDRALRAIG